MAKRINRLIVDKVRWFGLMAFVFVLGGGWMALSAVPSSSATGDRLPSPREGFLAPDFTLERLGGDSVTLSDLIGKAVVVNFWASWCPPCRAEMPALQQVYEDYRDRGLEVLAVNTTYQDSETAATDFIRERGLNFPVLFETSGVVARQYQVWAMPTTVFIDREGVIRSVIIGGPMSEVTLRTTIEESLREIP